MSHIGGVPRVRLPLAVIITARARLAAIAHEPPQARCWCGFRATTTILVDRIAKVDAMRTLGTMVAFIILAGCVGEVDELACTVPLEQCREGLFFGSCGGGAPPVLACSSTMCRWYSGGCPVGFRASDCPPDDVCCHATADGEWVFDASVAPYTTEAAHDVAAIGAAVVDERSPANLVVIADASAGAPTASLVCSPGNPLRFCEALGVFAEPLWSRELSFVKMIRMAGAFSGQFLYLEIVPTGDVPIARAFFRDYDDIVGAVAWCFPFTVQVSSGTLRLSTLDLASADDVHGVLAATLEDGHSFELTF